MLVCWFVKEYTSISINASLAHKNYCEEKRNVCLTLRSS